MMGAAEREKLLPFPIHKEKKNLIYFRLLRLLHRPQISIPEVDVLAKVISNVLVTIFKEHIIVVI